MMIIILLTQAQIIYIMYTRGIAMYSAIRAESAMTIRPSQYALQMHEPKESALTSQEMCNEEKQKRE